MAGKPQIKTLERDNLLVGTVYQHKGEQNVISSKQIATILKHNGYETKRDDIHKIIRKVVFERHLPICSINGKGYFWATTKEEIQMSIDDLQGRVAEMTNRIELLQSFIIN